MSCDLAGKIGERRQKPSCKAGMASVRCVSKSQTLSGTRGREYGREGHSARRTARKAKADYGHSF